jgi:hypothetical protein
MIQHARIKLEYKLGKMKTANRESGMQNGKSGSQTEKKKKRSHHLLHFAVARDSMIHNRTCCDKTEVVSKT